MLCRNRTYSAFISASPAWQKRRFRQPYTQLAQQFVGNLTMSASKCPRFLKKPAVSHGVTGWPLRKETKASFGCFVRIIFRPVSNVQGRTGPPGTAHRDNTSTTLERPAQARAQNKGRRNSVVRSTDALSQGLAPAVATAPLPASTQDRLSGTAFFSKGNEILAAPIRSGIETTGFERTVTSVCAKRFEKGDGPATWR